MGRFDISVKELYDNGQADYSIYNGVFRCEDKLAMHYGLWDEKAKNLSEAQRRENEYVKEKLDLKKGDRILDAGCGVGGTAIYLAKKYGFKIEGITLSSTQAKLAGFYSSKYGVRDLVMVYEKDFHGTDFPDRSFDKVFSVESADHSDPISQFLKEMHRILREKGKLLLVDAYLSKPKSEFDRKELDLLDVLTDAWSIKDPHTLEHWTREMEEIGYKNIRTEDLTDKVRKTARRIYLLSSLAWPIFFLLHKFRILTKAHYANCVAAIAQKELFEKGLLVYHSILAEK